MIRKSVLKTRAAHGYAWLRDVGPSFGLDVTRLHLRPELIDVQDRNWCPLSHSDTQDPPAGGWNHYGAICSRLQTGFKVPGTNKFRKIFKIDNFLNDNGFTIETGTSFGAWGWLPGTERDWRLLNEAWREVIVANKPAAVNENVPR